MDKELNLEERTYQFIGHLAIFARHEGIQIKFSTLIQILENTDMKKYIAARGMASGINAAYRYWETKDEETRIAITEAYVDKDGYLAWD